MSDFIFTEHYEFDWPVVVPMPEEGDFAEQQFTGRFCIVDEDEMRAPYTGESYSELISEERDRVAKFFLGWRGIKQKDGTDLPVSDANKDLLLSQRHIRLAITEAYAAAVLRHGNRIKNSEPPRS